MSRRWLIAGALFLAVVSALTMLTTTGSGADGSGLSLAPRGLVAARRYLERRGTPVQLLDEPLSDRTMPAVLVMAFPFQRIDDLAAVHDLLRRGTTVVYAFSGDAVGAAESTFADALGLEWVKPRSAPPLNPARWRAFASARWALAPVEPGATALALDIRIPERVPQAPEDAETLFRAPSGLPLVFTYHVGRGRAIVLPVEVLTNAGLARTGHLDLLERLRHEVPGVWTFDEFHHGLSAPAMAVPAGSRRVLDLYLLQLALLYGLALLAVVRRFGPAWSDPPVTTGSAGAFLTGLGVLHHRLGHHDAARQLLRLRARELHPHLNLELPEAAGSGPDALIALATAISRQQRQPRRTS